VDSPEISALFQSELPLVETVIRQLRVEIGPLEADECRSFGREGLLDAARRYEPDRGASFRRYAGYKIRWAILDGMRSHGRLSRRNHEKVRALQAAVLASEGMAEDAAAAVAGGLRGAPADARMVDYLSNMATAMAMAFCMPLVAEEEGEIAAWEDARDPEQSAETAELMELARTHLAELPEKEAAFIQRHFLQGEDIDDIARDFGLSKSWGSRMLAKGMASLTKKMRQAAR
jgi:RNA polymerase sigma factor for flagellar operon FliA